MKCERRDFAIAMLAGGDLAARRAERLQRHLSACPRCRALHEGLSEQRLALMDSAPKYQRSADHVNVDGVLARTQPTGRRHPSRAMAVALIAAALIGMIAFQLTDYEDASPPSAPPLIEAVNNDVPQAIVNPEPVRHAQVKIQMVTNNPDVVIYWLGDSAGD